MWDPATAPCITVPGFDVVNCNVIIKDWDWYSINPIYSHAQGRDACIEGDKEQITKVYEAIRDKQGCYHKRCAVATVDGVSRIWSPRNSQHTVIVSDSQRDKLLADLEKVLGINNTK
jgi:hypothetical protein